jgi:hypothetical protein
MRQYTAQQVDLVAGAVAGVFLRKFPDCVMPTEEVLEAIQSVIGEPKPKMLYQVHDEEMSQPPKPIHADDELPDHIQAEADRRKAETQTQPKAFIHHRTGEVVQPDPLVRRSELNDLCLRNSLTPPAEPDRATHSVDRVMNDVGLLEHDPKSYSAGFRAGRRETIEAVVMVIPSYLLNRLFDIDLPKVPNE